MFCVHTYELTISHATAIMFANDMHVHNGVCMCVYSESFGSKNLHKSSYVYSEISPSSLIFFGMAMKADSMMQNKKK